MDVREFLDTFKTKLGPGPVVDQNAAKVALNFVFNDNRAFLNQCKPTKDDTRKFVSMLKRAVVAEGKHIMPRRNALDNIHFYNENPGKSAFIGINPHVFAFQLAARVRDPSLIDQRQTDFCAVNSMMIGFARHDPEKFVDYAISLMRTGNGFFYQLPVKANIDIIKGNIDGIGDLKQKLDTADFVILASLGVQTEQINNLTKTQKYGMTRFQMRSWMNKAEFGCINDNVFTLKTTGIEQRCKNFSAAANDLRQGRMVIIATHRNLEDCMTQAKRGANLLAGQSGASYNHDEKRKVGVLVTNLSDLPSATQEKDDTNHWTVVSRLAINAGTVDIKLYTWGNPSNVDCRSTSS